MDLTWTQILNPGEPLWAKAVRLVAVYLFLLIGLRLAGKRELGQLNPFDLVVLLVLSNTVQNAIIGPDNSVLGGMFSAALLLAVNYLVVRFLYGHPGLDRLVEGDAEVLVHRGRVVSGALKRNLITRAELEAAARRQGIEDLSTVSLCRLEVGGALTFLQTIPTEEERRHAEILARLADLERQVSELAGGRGGSEGGATG